MPKVTEAVEYEEQPPQTTGLVGSVYEQLPVGRDGAGSSRPLHW